MMSCASVSISCVFLSSSILQSSPDAASPSSEEVSSNEPTGGSALPPLALPTHTTKFQNLLGSNDAINYSLDTNARASRKTSICFGISGLSDSSDVGRLWERVLLCGIGRHTFPSLTD